MNKIRAEARAFARCVAESELARSDAVQLFVIPPFTAVAEVADLLADTSVAVGVQNVHWADAGPWTGEISVSMAADCGATIAEIGHSERRAYFNDTDESVALKVAAALRGGLTPLVCVGDERADFEAGRSSQVLARQARAAVSRIPREQAGKVTLAYEPVWSIGEGGIPAEPAFADEQHAVLKATMRDLTGCEVRVIYGGSVTLENCVALSARPHIDGLFIGRSAWQPEDYLAIVRRVLAAKI